MADLVRGLSMEERGMLERFIGVFPDHDHLLHLLAKVDQGEEIDDPEDRDKLGDTVLTVIYHNGKSQDPKLDIYNSLIKSHILDRRASAEQSAEILKVVKTKARDLGFYPLQLEVLLQRRLQTGRLTNASLGDDQLTRIEQTLNLISDEELKVVDELVQHHHNFDFNFKLNRFLNTKGYARREEDLNHIKYLYFEYQHHFESEPKNTRLSLLYHINLRNYYSAIGDHESSYRHSNTLIRQMEHGRMEHKRYLKAHGNHFNILFHLRKFDEISANINKLLNINIKDEDVITLRDLVLVPTQMNYTNNVGKFEEAIKLNEKKGKIIFETNGGGLGERVTLPYRLFVAYAHFGAGKYKECNDKLADLTIPTSSKYRQDVHILALLLHLTTLYEQGNFKLLNSKVNEIQDFINLHYGILKVEALFLQFMKNASTSEEGRTQERFKMTLLEIEQILMDPQENLVQEYFDMVSWFESKAHDIPFREVVEQKAVKQS